MNDIDAERERREEAMREILSAVGDSSDSEDADEEEFDASAGPELEALLPYYQQVEDEALKVAQRYFHGIFVADPDVHKQKLFEYGHNGHTYRCYVDIYNENEKEINIIEVKATTNSKYILKYDKDGKPQGLCFSDKKRGGDRYPLFVKDGNIWRLNTADSTVTDEATVNFDAKKGNLLDRYRAEGKYPHDVAFQKFVIEHALRKAGDDRKVNYYLAVLNCEYVCDGTVDAAGQTIYNNVNGQEVITFIDMNEIAADYQPIILKEVATLESYISTLHNTDITVPVGKWCAWGSNTECIFRSHCYQKLRSVPETNSANKYISFRGFSEGNISDKYQLVNESYWKFDDVLKEWLKSDNHIIQRDCYDNNKEHVDKEKMQAWFDHIEYPIYHFDFESFPCPLPRFKGEHPYQQSCFEFSLHIEREAGVCDKVKHNVISLNQDCKTDERKALAKDIVDNFEFNEDGTLHGTMLAQNTSFEIGRLTELAELFPEYKDKLLAIANKSADLMHLLKTSKDLYIALGFCEKESKTINYYHKDLSGSYSIKKTLPVLVPSLTYKGMDVGNGVQAYIAYLNYDSEDPTFGIMTTKAQRRAALRLYCQQDTWAMVEILRAVREKIK